MNAISTTRKFALLLRLERRRRSVPSGKRLVFTVFLPLLNLFFCAYYERHMAAADSLAALRLFLSVQCCTIGLLAAVHFFSTLGDMVRKIRLLPLRPLSRATFVTMALFRDPLALGILATTAFGLTVMLHPLAVLIPVLALAVFLLGAGIQSLVGSALLVASEHSDRAAGITLLSLCFVMASLLWSVMFATDGFPLAVPPVIWASGALDALTRGDVAGAALNFLPLMIIPVLIPWAAALWMERR